MSSGMGTAELRDLFTPWVLRAAFRKVADWYRREEFYDPAEWLAWKAQPWEYLAQLGEELASGSYQPWPFPLIPYPKKGDRTRHYVMPSVRDQIAFMAYIILLGPFLEACMPNVSFGNRLFRPRVLITTSAGTPEASVRRRWLRAPFSLGEPRLYDRFEAGYGLFRRLLQWIVNRVVLGKEITSEIVIEDPSLLPYYEVLRNGLCGSPTDLFYARLDLSLAYPSVDRSKLRSQLKTMLASQSTTGDRWGRPSFPDLRTPGQGVFSSWIEPERPFAGPHPWHILTRDQDKLLSLTDRLCNMLDSVYYNPWDDPEQGNIDDLVNPKAGSPNGAEDECFDTHGIWPVNCHLSSEWLRTHRFGLPTGLAASGVLLNVALTPVDNHMCWLYERAIEDQKPPVFYFRFVDDIVLLSPDMGALENALQELKDQLQQAGQFRISADKAKPESLRSYLQSLYKSDRKEKLILRPSECVTRGNIELFTTTVVREMSEIADEGLEEAFGAPGLSRLEELLALASREDDDLEVAKDARLTFAVNQLARATWPSQAVLESDRVLEPGSYVERILRAAEAALRRHPWRFKLWRAILIIALRASIVDGNDRGRLWLEQNILPLIRWGSNADSGRLSTRSWEDVSPEATDVFIDGGVPTPNDNVPANVRGRRRRHRQLRTSFHRAWFWRQWAKTVRALQGIAEDRLSAPPEAWASHFTPDHAKKLLRWFGNWQAWARILYGSETSGADPKSVGRALWWWEAEALVDAWLAASVPTQTLLRALRNPRPEALRFPPRALRRLIEKQLSGNLLDLQKSLATILGYVGAQRNDVEQFTSEQRLALLWCSRCLSRRSSSFFGSLGDTLRPRAGSDALLWAALARISLWDYWLDIKNAIGTRLTNPAVPSLKGTGRLGQIWSALIRLDAFAQIRRLLLAHGTTVYWGMFSGWFPEIVTATISSPDAHSLIEALYAFADADDKPRDAKVPAIELPFPIAAALVRGIRGILERQPKARQSWITPDTVFVSTEAFEHLTRSRKAMLEAVWNTNSPAYDAIAEPLIKILSIPETRLIRGVAMIANNRRAPHPLFLFPDLVFRWRSNIRGKEAWCSTILLLWMLSGGEHILDKLYEVAPWHMPLSERGRLRSRFMLPESVWRRVEEALGSAQAKYEPWAFDPDDLKPDPLDPTLPGSRQRAVPADMSGMGSALHLKARDVRFNQNGQWYVIPGDHTEARADAPSPGRGAPTFLPELHVRLIQIVSQPCWSQWLVRLLRGTGGQKRPDVSELVDEISERLAEAKARARAQVQYEKREHLLMTPEWSVPAEYVRKLEQFVHETGVAVLAGLLPRELPRAVPAVRQLRQEGWRPLVNEVVLILPAIEGTTNGAHRALPAVRVHTFWIRKPFASVAELGLIRLLSKRSARARWTFVPGLEWYRFAYEDWGSFSVAICSDILDTSIWDWLKGRIQHLLVVAWNEDVSLFDQVSWTRGYELYSNVALVNHGSDGGSVVWTPKHGKDKEVFHVHGSEHGLAVTVSVPVRDLIEAQDKQLGKSIEKRVEMWASEMDNRSYHRKDGARRDASFKTPPPTYRRRD